LCVDEKSQIQALNRTQPGLPLKKGRCGTMRHSYTHQGDTTLFATLSLLDGRVIGECMSRHRHQKFIRFLKKINADTLAATTFAIPSLFHPDVEFVDERGRAMVRDLTDTCIRRGRFKNVLELSATIRGNLDHHNQNPRIFVWTAPVEGILTKAAKPKEMLEDCTSGRTCAATPLPQSR